MPSINDLIFARMIDPDWTTLERRLVDKITAKEEAARLCPGLRVAATLATVDMVAVASPTALYDRLRGLIGTDAIAKPSQASGGTVFLRNVSGPADLAELHALATTDYAAVMREMQYAGLPRRVIVEALIPTQDGRPPDDFKFHCINGEPLLCQIDHARFGTPWGRIFRLPDFAPMDPADGIAMPPGVAPPDPERLAAMLDAARTLAAPFDYVRVDLYNGLDGIYFGELTFTPSASLGIAPSQTRQPPRQRDPSPVQPHPHGRASHEHALGLPLQHQHPPLALSRLDQPAPALGISRANRFGLRIQQPRKQDRAPRRGCRDEIFGQLDQRPGEDVGDEEVERRARRQRRMRHAVGDRQREFAPPLAKRHPVQHGIVASDVDADGIDVGGDRQRLGPQRHCAERQQPGTRADIGDPLKALAAARHAVERREAPRASCDDARSRTRARRRSES